MRKNEFFLVFNSILSCSLRNGLWFRIEMCPKFVAHFKWWEWRNSSIALCPSVQTTAVVPIYLNRNSEIRAKKKILSFACDSEATNENYNNWLLLIFNSKRFSFLYLRVSRFPINSIRRNTKTKEKKKFFYVKNKIAVSMICDLHFYACDSDRLLLLASFVLRHLRKIVQYCLPVNWLKRRTSFCVGSIPHWQSKAHSN